MIRYRVSHAMGPDLAVLLKIDNTPGMHVNTSHTVAQTDLHPMLLTVHIWGSVEHLMEFTEAFDIAFVLSPVINCCAFTLNSLTSLTNCTHVWAYVIDYCQPYGTSVVDPGKIAKTYP